MSARGHRDIAGNEDGVTLVELLVAITILGIIFPVITGALFVGFRTASATESSLTSSVTLDGLSHRFQRDVAAATALDTAAPGACSVSDPPVVHIAAVDADIYYAFDADTGRLTRTRCPASGPASAALVGILAGTDVGNASVTLVCGDPATPCPDVRAATLSLTFDPDKPAVEVVAYRRVDPS